MTEPHKRNRHPKYKTAYRVKNWREYDKSLRDRGDITLWITPEAIAAWRAPMTGKRGTQPIYADIAKDAVPSPTAATMPTQRDQHISAIEREGRFAWKRTSGYYDQAYAENAFARYKRTFGGGLRAKRDESQAREASLGCELLNRMRMLGRPQSYPVR